MTFPRNPRGAIDAHVESLSKPCSRRLPGVRRADGSLSPQRWCLLPDQHPGDCHGVTPEEILACDFGPEASKRRRW